jgi:hypothetical protein
MSRIVLLDFARLNYKITKIQRSESWIMLFYHQVKREDDKKNSVGWTPVDIARYRVSSTGGPMYPWSSSFFNCNDLL